jgi:hypothetical protein
MRSKDEMKRARFCERSKDELANLYQVFDKYLRDDNKEQAWPPKNSPFGEKPKVANRLYRQACADLGVSLCFFKNFGAWQQFVHGEMEETEFYVKALEEIRRFGLKQRSYN